MIHARGERAPAGAAGLRRSGLLFFVRGSGLCLGHLGPHPGAPLASPQPARVAAHGAGARSAVVGLTRAGLLQLHVPSCLGRRSRALFCFSVSFWLVFRALHRLRPCDPAALHCAPPSSCPGLGEHRGPQHLGSTLHLWYFECLPRKKKKQVKCVSLACIPIGQQPNLRGYLNCLLNVLHFRGSLFLVNMLRS